MGSRCGLPQLRQVGSAWFSLALPDSAARAALRPCPLRGDAAGPNLVPPGSAWLSAATRGAGASFAAAPAIWRRSNSWHRIFSAYLGCGYGTSALLSSLARFNLVQPGSAWLSASRADHTACLRGQPGRLQIGSAWLNLAQLGSACFTLRRGALCRLRLSFVLAWLSLAQPGLAWLSARRTGPRARRRGWSRLWLFGSSWFILAQPCSAGLARARTTSAGIRPPRTRTWLRLVQLGSAWLSARRAGLLGVQARLAGVAAGWLSLVQFGAALLSLPNLRAPHVGSRYVRGSGSAWLSFAQLGSAPAT